MTIHGNVTQEDEMDKIANNKTKTPHSQDT
jgi:hypothetical protein